jgi:hypothetical protein
MGWLVLLVLFMYGCEENEFPVSPLPEVFEMIPPSDVGLLTAIAGDAEVLLKWGLPPEKNISAIYVKNVNTDTEKKLQGDAVEVGFTGLTNFVSQDFVVRTENDKGLLSLGAKITSVPFSSDEVKPAPVTGLMGFKLTAASALATWNNPSDVDLARIVITMGNETLAVPRESSYAIIGGDASKGLRVQAVDFSGNFSDVAETAVDRDMVKITGSDDGVEETLYMELDPSVVIIDGYRVTCADGTVASVSASRGVCKIPLSALEATAIWKQPIKIGLISNGQLVTEYDYYAYNNIAGTLRAPFYDRSEGSVNIEGDMRNVGSLGDGSVLYYDVVVRESGTYSVVAYQARPDGSSAYEIYMDDVLLGRGTAGSSGNWGPPYNPFPGPTDLAFEAGSHVLKIRFGGSGNYQKFVFSKN